MIFPLRNIYIYNSFCVCVHIHVRVCLCVQGYVYVNMYVCACLAAHFLSLYLSLLLLLLPCTQFGSFSLPIHQVINGGNKRVHYLPGINQTITYLTITINEVNSASPHDIQY